MSMTDNLRVFLWVALALAVWLTIEAWQRDYPPAATAPPTVAATQPPAVAPSLPAVPGAPGPTARLRPVPPMPAPGSAPRP